MRLPTSLQHPDDASLHNGCHALQRTYGIVGTFLQKSVDRCVAEKNPPRSLGPALARPRDRSAAVWR
jgi:hypothetical protein